MLVKLVSTFDRLIGTSVVTKSDGMLLRRRYAALQRQQPWLYTILLANLLGLQIALLEDKSVPLLPTLIMTVIILIRAIRWLRDRRRHRQLEYVQREMRKTFVIAALFNFAFACWTCWLFLNVGASHLNEIVLFAGLAAVGCTYAMTGFPGGARIPLLVLLVPLEAMLILTGEPSKIGIAVSIVIVSGVTLRLLNVHDDGFVKLVRSYVQIGAERKRAVEAEKIAIEERAHVQILANRDVLTGLMNRRGFLASLDQLSSPERRRLALVLIDLDGFKPVNDTFGHPSGDALLIEVSRRLQSLGLRRNAVSRLGGDEFAILCQCDDVAAAFEVASRAVAALGVSYNVEGRTLSISASAGVSFQHDDSRVDAMRRADLALYQSKKMGRGQVTVFTNDLERGHKRRRLIEQALSEPAIDDDIEVVFQPIFKLDNMELHSFEALARWRHAEMGWISPSEFIPITEQICVIESISDALLRRALSAAHAWPSSIKLSFNISAVQLCTPGSAGRILSVLAEQSFDPCRMQIEVTETALLGDFDVARANLSALRQRGMSIVLDDFGAGYSSVAYLRHMQFQAIKLDGSLVTAMTDRASGFPLLRGVILLCNSMGLPCVAEHIETEQQLEELRSLGCQFGQGFLLSQPLRAQAAALLAAIPVNSALARSAA
jgi:diguanylate cyclase (GGDEF)-like protein